MFEKFEAEMKKKHPGKKYMDLAPEVRDQMTDAIDQLSQEFAEYMGADTLLFQLSTKSGRNNTHYYWNCGAAQMMNVLESALARLDSGYDPGVFAAIEAYSKHQSDGGEVDGSDVFAQVVSELPREQQEAIKSSLIKIKKRIEGKGKGESSADDGDALNDLLG